MIRRTMLGLLLAGLLLAFCSASQAQAQQAYDRQWGGQLQHPGLEPLLSLPLRHLSAEFLGTRILSQSENLYFRYPPEMRIPVYNKAWHNEYPQPRRYYQGHDFILDVF